MTYAYDVGCAMGHDLTSIPPAEDAVERPARDILPFLAAGRNDNRPGLGRVHVHHMAAAGPIVSPAVVPQHAQQLTILHRTMILGESRSAELGGAMQCNHASQRLERERPATRAAHAIVHAGAVVLSRVNAALTREFGALHRVDATLTPCFAASHRVNAALTRCPVVSDRVDAARTRCAVVLSRVNAARTRCEIALTRADLARAAHDASGAAAGSAARRGFFGPSRGDLIGRGATGGESSSRGGFVPMPLACGSFPETTGRRSS